MKAQPDITNFLKADRPEKILGINCGSSLSDDSKLTVLLVPTDEERMMARETLRVKGRVE